MSNSNASEEFRPIPGWPSYQASNLGNLRRKWTPGRRTPDQESFIWVPVKPHPDTKGYLRVHLYEPKQHRSRAVHQLVLEAFVGPCPPGMECRHFPDRTRTNNRLENLSWATRSQNARDKSVHGTMLLGSKDPMAKLSEADVLTMREMRLSGSSRQQIASRFGVAVTEVSRAMLGALWKHIAPTDEEKLALIAAGVAKRERHYRAKLTSELAQSIRTMAAGGMTGAAIGRRLGISRSTACRVIKGTAWN